MREHSLKRAEWIQSVISEQESPLLGYAMRLLGDLDRARDVVQDTLLKLCSEDPNRLLDRVRPWLFTVCRNRAIDELRRDQRFDRLEDAGLDDKPDDGPEPVVILEHQQAVRNVLRQLGDLPRNQQEVIRLKFIEEFSYEEISQITGLSVTNVGFLIHSGLKTIRLEFQKSDQTPALRRIK